MTHLTLRRSNLLAPIIAIVLTACGGAKGDATPAAKPESAVATATDAATAAKPGEATYGQICTSCHQPTGLGVDGTYPPLKGSPWLNGNPEVPISIVLAGLQGEISVEGKTYNGAMQPWGMLGDEDIANVLTYARSQWGNTGSAVTAAQVKAVRDRIGNRTAWTADELRKAYPGAGS